MNLHILRMLEGPFSIDAAHLLLCLCFRRQKQTENPSLSMTKQSIGMSQKGSGPQHKGCQEININFDICLSF